MDRRAFLRVAAMSSGAALLHGRDALTAGARLASGDERPSSTRDSILDHPAAACPIDTVVIVMMENRSFDHYLGWLGDDHAYREAGRRLYGKKFRIDARVHAVYADPSGH